MDKNAIKKYAVWAREQLIEKVTARAIRYEIVDGQELDDSLEAINGEVLTETERKQRKALIQKIKSDGYTQVMEEVAYTWFNRFVAIRFMEVNGYLPSHVRVFSDENGAFKPQILAEAIHLELPGLDMNVVMQHKEDANEEELFKYLLKIQCNALNEILPQMFQKIEDYTELLLPDYLLREGSVIEKLVNEIPEDNFDVNTDNGQIEIIGWMYQYYISAKHDDVIDMVYGKVVEKGEIPAATQLFTTDWVVKYLVDNSVGRYWIERNPDSKLADELTYFVKQRDGSVRSIEEKITPQEVTVFDPCVGSGHFLVYAFDVLMKIYIEYGFSERDAASEIVKNNLFGLDIDGRAAQLAYFAVMMKARQYDRRFLTRGVQPNVYEIIESNSVDKSFIDYFCNGNIELKENLATLLDVFEDAKEYGSILRIPECDYVRINERLQLLSNEISIYNAYLLGDFKSLMHIAEMMSRKYAVVATNPPYLNKYDEKLKKYINENYKDYSGDLFSVFMYVNGLYCVSDGYTAFMTPFVWMFIKTYEKLRNYILENKDIATLIQFEYSAYEEATVPICSFILLNEKAELNGQYFRLTDFKGGMAVQESKFLEALHDTNSNYTYEVKQNSFHKIPSSPISYWASENVYSDFEKGVPLSELAPPRQGIATSNNERFLRLWTEVAINRIGFNCEKLEDTIDSGFRWIPYNKGGEYRKWYGNQLFVVNWENDGYEIRNYYENGKIKSRPQNTQYFFRPSITWSDISSAYFGVRYCPGGFGFDMSGSSCFPNEDMILYITGFMCSKISTEFMRIMNPSIHNQVGNIATLPLIYDNQKKPEIDNLVQQCIDITKADWDSYEVSWNYIHDPLVSRCNVKNKRIEDCFTDWEKTCEERFVKLQELETKINSIFLEIYGLKNEITASVDSNEITISKADRKKDVINMISYAVGCMFGRYSLDRNGLAYAGGEWDSSMYKSFTPDKDAIIPICDDEYFSDDIVGLFIKFIENVFGSETLEENLQFIAEALGGSGSARDIIRDYFINDFYLNHVKMYQKKPIYWLFDSGKKNGFKCLIYMHRYQTDTIARIRTDYVHEQQARYRTAIEEIDKRIDTVSASEKVKLTKKLNTLKAQDEEIHAYEEKIHHLADQMISIDLDDGVKHNYALFQDVLAKIK